MGNIRVPKPVFRGFNILGNLTSEQIQGIVQSLNDFPITVEKDDIIETLESFDFLDESQATSLFLVVSSFSRLMERDNISTVDLSKDLAESYVELSDKSYSEEFIQNLEKNILLVLENYSKISLFDKIRALKHNNQNNFISNSINTDLRFFFKNSNEEVKKREALVIHHMVIEYVTDEGPKSIQLTLDLEDLISLKEEVQKSIDNEELIRKDYNNFINIL